MDQTRVRSPLLLLLDQPEDTQGGERRSPYLRTLQLSNIVADQPPCECYNPRAMLTNPYTFLGWRNAAGNAVCIKSSELLPATQAGLAELLPPPPPPST